MADDPPTPALAACALAYTHTPLMSPQYVATTLKISANLNFLQQIKDGYTEDKFAKQL